MEPDPPDQHQEWVQALMAPPSLTCEANDSDEILKGLFLGNSTAARAASNASPVRAIVNCAGRNNSGTIDGVSVFQLPELSAAGIAYLELDMLDGLSSPPLAPFLDKGADFIEECFLKGSSPVLVHCAAGKSRSASCILAFLVKHRGMSLRDAAILMREKRHRAYPRVHFWEQLRAWEVATRCIPASSLPAEALALHVDNCGGQALENDHNKVKKLVEMGFG
eukprot:CAMPEP_0114569698 /NCGR_PEP_ID=MMETSP0114-20121206/16778_1 /TAXON_ID=31324 /ORGANISM="Goniomonas sp, Strain m" /LENGTH=221 /DNA_ID=CAMNT_0001756621 /DNA_START=30 /DNA_END=692 /DNA_ORIENTATION=+